MPLCGYAHCMCRPLGRDKAYRKSKVFFHGLLLLQILSIFQHTSPNICVVIVGHNCGAEEDRVVTTSEGLNVRYINLLMH